MGGPTGGGDAGTEARPVAAGAGRTPLLLLSLGIYLLVGAVIYPAWFAAVAAPPHDAVAALPVSDSQVEYGRLTQLGIQYYGQQQYPEAEEAFRKATEYAPDQALAYNNLGSALNAQGKWDEAIAVLEHALALDPDLAIARNNLAWARGERATQTK
jgi:tetratricopeptide (TPR) repeat protein